MMLALAIALAACGTGTSSPGPASTRPAEPNQAGGSDAGAIDAGTTGGTDAIPGVAPPPGLPSPPVPPPGPPPVPPGPAPMSPDAGIPVPPAAGTKPLPKRLIVLGDSIVACQGVGNKEGAACSPKKLHVHLATGAAPGISYENLAVNGADTSDVTATQLARATPGAGAVLVVVYVGGNDLRPYLIASDMAAEAGFARITPSIETAWKTIFTHFADRAKFPDGATVLVNTQYDPFDDCTAPPYFVSAKKHELLRSFNDVVARLARANDAIVVDQFTPFLGHGHHVRVAACPHYRAGSTPYMGDLIHPNAAGHEQIFQQWKLAVDGLYGKR